MVRVRVYTPKVTEKSFKGMGIKKEGNVFSIEAIDGNVKIIDIKEKHKIRVGIGITKNPHYKHKITKTGSATYKNLGLVIPINDDDMFLVLKETIIDLATMMKLPTEITNHTLLAAIKHAVSDGEVALIGEGNRLQICPTQELIEARKWITSEVPKKDYKKCNLLL